MPPRFRISASLLAGAIGDALGTPYEGQPATIPACPNQWDVSDDTLLTMATCRAIANARRVDPPVIAEEMANLWRTGPIRGIGASTAKALRDLAAGQHWALSGASGEHAAGNGAAMRIAPVAFMLDLRSPGARQTLRDVARITHRNDEAYAGALAISLGLRLHGTKPEMPHSVFLNTIASELPDSNVQDALIRLSHLDSTVSLETAAAQCGTSAYVAESVPLALFASCQSWRALPDALLSVVALGGDTDTNAALTGQLLAQRGFDSPPDWVQRLEIASELLRLGLQLERLCQ